MDIGRAIGVPSPLPPACYPYPEGVTHALDFGPLSVCVPHQRGFKVFVFLTVNGL